jgi:hypothetical protein
MLDRDTIVNQPARWAGARRAGLVVIAVAVALVLLRAVVPTVYEGYYFDSDQAIIGLMARRLSNFEGFPLFYDGLNYILGVESWIIAPFFWIARSSVTVMRIPLVALNAVVAVWLVIAIGRRLDVHPAMALAGALPFIMPAPAVAGQLLETAGACVEPFVYVLSLWALRRRPLAFGAVLALGFLHREFTIFAVPALLIAEAAGGAAWDASNQRRAVRAGAGFAAVWLAVAAVKLYQAGGSLGLQAVSLAGQTCFAPDQLAPRAATVFTQALPVLYGGTMTRLADFRMNTPVVHGWSAIGWMVAIALAVMLLRLARSWMRQPRLEPGETFFVYLALVGVFTAAAYPLSCNIVPGQPPLLRYILLGLLLPIGAFGAFMSRERSRALRAIAPIVFAAWGAANLAGNITLIRASVTEPPSNEHRVIADYLVNHGIRYGRAIYWDAYAIDFLARERVIVASVDLVRIQSYQKQVDEHDAFAVNLPRVPCSGGPQVASWCIQPPAR